MQPTIRAIRPEEIPALERALGQAFGGDPVEADRPHFAAVLEVERTRCAFDGNELVGSSSAFSFDLVVPGTALPTSGVTMISVRSTDRRRGLLRAMMAELFADAREREEPLAALWASESSIYGRFGYGAAAELCEIEIERAHGAFARPLVAPGTMRMLEAEEARKLLPAVYDEASRLRPGCLSRSAVWWEHQRLAESSSSRRGASHSRFVLYEEGGRARGYLQYRVRQGGRDGLPGNTLQVVELQGVDGVAQAALWRHALDVDLNTKVSAWNQPVDDPLPWLLSDPRRARRSVRDSLWVRILDVPAALSARAYRSEAALRFELHDEHCPWNQGRFLLEAGPDGTRCLPDSGEPELRLGASQLGALYLGGTRVQTLARAGLVEGSPEALRCADALFGWDVAPWCPEIF